MQTQQQNANGMLLAAAIVLAGALIATALVAGVNAGSQGESSAGGQSSFGNGNSAAAESIPAVSDADFVRGNPDAPVKIIEYSDFQCPFCGRLHPDLKRVVEEYDGEVVWAFRHFPLAQIHNSARSAAIASECIAAQGGDDAFWTFADAAFANQQQLGTEFYLQQAQELDLNTDQFRGCLEQDSRAAAVDAEYRQATEGGGRGTPYIVVVNGQGEAFPFSGALPYERIRGIVEEALATS